MTADDRVEGLLRIIIVLDRVAAEVARYLARRWNVAKTVVVQGVLAALDEGDPMST